MFCWLRRKNKNRFWRQSLTTAFLLYSALISRAWSDFDMTYPISTSSPPGPALTLTNRQPSAATGNYIWNDDVFEVVAMGFDTTSTSSFPAAANYNVLSNDSLGAAQFRYPIVAAQINTNPGASDAINQINMSLTGAVAYPRFPHMVVREVPAWGPTWPDTTIYAPAANASDINAATGALSNADYYNPGAWVSHDDAPLTVITTGPTAQHPTQLWIGMPDMPANTALDDSSCNCNNVSGNTMHQASPTSALGYYFAPNSPTGASGIGYNHTAGVGPGGLMWAMSSAFVQEFFGYNIRVPLVMGSQETAMGLFSDTGWAPVGTDPATSALGYPYQFVGLNADATDAVSGYPDFWTQGLFSPYANFTTGSGNYQVVTHTIVFAQDLSSRYYGYFASARAMKLLKLTAIANDPYLLFKAVADGYNLGPYQTTPIWDMQCSNAERAAVAASTNVGTLPSPYNILANNNYTAQVTDLSRRIGRTNTVYDWGMTWGDVQDFLGDLRTYHYGNGIPTNADWTSMTNELQTAFNSMEGKSPNVLSDGTMVGATRISFRYNWLTMLRIMKKWLPQPSKYLAKGEDMNDQIGNYGGYNSTSISYSGSMESSNPCNPVHLAPEIYWTNPTYTAPLAAQVFSPITICNSSPIPVASDVKYYNDDSTTLTVRWALSPGDPTAGGYSLWHDMFKTGGIIGDVATQIADWTTMAAGGAGAVAGSTHYTGSVPVAGITGLRRLYMDADDGDGFRTIGWVDVYLQNCATTPTNTPTNTNTSTPTSTATATQTSTPSNTFTNTPTKTYTSTFTNTITNTATFTNTFTSTPSNTATNTYTQTFTSTPVNTNTFTSTPTLTFTHTASSTATSTFSSTITYTFTNTPILTNTFTSTPTLTWTNTSSPTPIFTFTDTSTPNATATFTDTPLITSTYTDTPTATFSSTDSPTPVNTATSTNTLVLTATDTGTPTATLTFTYSFTPVFTFTYTNTPVATVTYTDSPTGTFTNTYTPTPNVPFTSTWTNTPTATQTTTNTATVTATTTATRTNTPVDTYTPTVTPISGEFFISKNVFTPDDQVQIHVAIQQVPGHYDLTIYNSAGEHIKTLDSQDLTSPFQKTYSWNGKNKFGDTCSSGVYVIYLTEPFKRLLGRVIFIH
jgi:hypothetical protein